MNFAKKASRGSNEVLTVRDLLDSWQSTPAGTTGNQLATFLFAAAGSTHLPEVPSFPSLDPAHSGTASIAQADKRAVAEILASSTKSFAKTQKVANQTIRTLNGQTRKLHRIGAGADVSNDLRKSDFLVQSQKPFRWVKNIFKKDRGPTHRRPSIKSQYLADFWVQGQKLFRWVKKIFKKERVPAHRGRAPANRRPSSKSQYLADFWVQGQEPFRWVNILKKDHVPAHRGRVPASRRPSIKSQYLIFVTLCKRTNWRRAQGVDIHDLGDNIWLQ